MWLLLFAVVVVVFVWRVTRVSTLEREVRELADKVAHLASDEDFRQLSRRTSRLEERLATVDDSRRDPPERRSGDADHREKETDPGEGNAS